MADQKHIIIYSHGFAVRKDDMSLFTDLAGKIPEAESILFDYYEVDEQAGKIFLSTFSEQVRKLKEVVANVRQANPGAIIDLIGHSQGTLVAALARPEGIRRAVLISPVFDIDIERTLSRYRTKPGVKIDLEGISEIPSSTGLTKIIPKEYWQERALLEPLPAYASLAAVTEVVAIEANQDELLSKVDPKQLDGGIKLLPLDGDHNFNPPNREKLIGLVRSLLL